MTAGTRQEGVVLLGCGDVGPIHEPMEAWRAQPPAPAPGFGLQRFDDAVRYMEWASEGFNQGFTVEGNEVVVRGAKRLSNEVST